MNSSYRKNTYFSFLFSFIFLLAACNNKKSSNTAENLEKAENNLTDKMIKNDTDKLSGKENDMQKNLEVLQKMQPLSLDELKKNLPEELNGIKKTNYSASVVNGTGYVSAKYKMDDDSSIEVGIWDCAGKMGAGIYSAKFMTFYNFEQEDDNGYTKRTIFEGHKAVERFEKNINEYTVTYFAGDRYLVILKGENTSIDQLKSASRSINLK